MNKLGKVFFVGAGPGDPSLLTIKGRDCLKKADIILYDNLANIALLDFSPKIAKTIYIGKEAKKHAINQEGINSLLVRLGTKGNIVVRLKSGDPLIFSPCVEEALALSKASVPFEFVPGITSAIAAPEYAGIPLVHEKAAKSFSVFSNFEMKTTKNSYWKKIISSTDTLVFHIVPENIFGLCSTLIKNGLNPTTPTAFIISGTTTKQRTLVTTLENASKSISKTAFTSPLILVIGNVVNIRKKLAWFDKKPLSGKTILVTKMRSKSSPLSNALKENGANVIEIPLVKISPPHSYAPLDDTLARISEFKWIVFISSPAIEIFFNRFLLLNKDIRTLSKLKIAVIGEATAHTLKKYGVNYDLMPDDFTYEALLEKLRPHINKKAPILIPHSTNSKDILENGLKKLGADITMLPVYQTLSTGNKEELINTLKNKTIDYVTFASSSAVTNFRSMLGKNFRLPKSLKIVTIGPITAKACIEATLKNDVTATDHTLLGLVEAILKHNQIMTE